MSIASLTVDLDLNTGQFKSQITMANGAIRNFSSTINGANANVGKMSTGIHGLGTKLRDVAVTLGQFRAAMHTVWMFTGEWVNQIIQANAKLERMQMLMGGVSKAATEDLRSEEAKASMEYVLQLAKSTPFALDELGNAFVKMKAAGIDPTNGSLVALSDSLAAFGGDNQALHRATIAVTQMASKGVISMEELRQQLGEAVPDAMRLMARGTNMSMQELVNAVSKGNVQATDAINRMFRQMAIAHAGAGERMMGTWTGLISRLKTEWLIFATEVGQEGGERGMFAEAKKAVEELIALMKSPEGVEFARSVGAGIASVIRGVVSLTKYLIENKEQVGIYVKEIITLFAAFKAVKFFGPMIVSAVKGIKTLGSLVSALGVAGGAASAFGLTLNTLKGLFATAFGPIGLFITAITMGISKLIDMKREADTTKEAIDAFYAALENGDEKSVTMDELGEVHSQIMEINAALAIYEKTKKLYQENPGVANFNKFASFKGTGGDILEEHGLPGEDDPEKLQERLLQLRDTLREGIHRIHTVQAEAGRDERVNAWANGLIAGLDEKKKALGGQLALIQDLFESKKIDSKEASARNITAVKEIFDPAVKELEAQRDRIQAAYPNVDFASGNLDQIPAGAQAQYMKLMEIIKSVRDERDALLQDFQTETTRTGAEKKDFSALKAQSALESLLNSTVAGIERLKGAGDPTSLAEFERLLTDTSKYGKNPDAGMVGLLRSLLAELDKLKAEDKYRKTLEDINSELDSMDAKALADLETAQRELSGDVYSDVSRGMAGLNRQLAAMRINIVPGSKEMKEFEERAAKLRDTVARTDLSNFTKELHDIALEARQATMTPEVRLESEYQSRTSLLRRNLEEQLRDFRGSEAEKLAIHRTFNDAMNALDQEFQFNSRTPLQKWIDQYKDITEEIRDVWAGAMDTITDSIMNMVETGKMSFSDLASSILKELLRVMTSKVVAQFAEFIMGMLGGGTGNVGTKTPVIAQGPKSASIGKSTAIPAVPQSYAPIGKSMTDTGFSKSAGSNNVVINLTNESGQPVQAEEKGRKFDGQQLVLDIVLSAASRPGKFREGMKGALR